MSVDWFIVGILIFFGFVCGWIAKKLDFLWANNLIAFTKREAGK